MHQAKRFTYDVSWVLASSIVNLVIGFLLRPIIARWLGATDLGLYQMVITIQGIVLLVAALGIPEALTKYVAEYRDDRDKLIQTIPHGIISSIITGIIGGVLLYALSGILAGFFDMPELAHLLKILAFVLPFTALLQVFLGTLNGLREMKTYAFLVILNNLLMVLFIIAFIWLGFGVKGAVFGILLSTIAVCILGFYPLRSFLRLNPGGFAQNIKKLILFGSQVFATNALGMMVTQIDIMMVGYFLAAEDVGYYSIAVSLTGMLWLVPSAIRIITYPAISEYWSKNDRQTLRELVEKSTKYSACILIPMGLGLGFFGRGIITTIFGSEFNYAASPLLILLTGRVIWGAATAPIGSAFTGMGKPDISLKINVLAAGINIVLDILLIPHFGIVGAAIATTTSLLVRVVAFLVLMPRILEVGINIKWFASAIGVACLAGCLFFVGVRFINLYLVGAIIVCAYTILVFKLFLKKEDKAIFRSLISSLPLRLNR